MLTSEDLPESLSGDQGPLVSVVLATYEPEESIKQAIHSIVNQTYGNIELIFVDGSGEQWLERLADNIQWIRHVPQDRSGVANAWNKGINIAFGKYVAFLADDDYYAPHKTARQVERLESTGFDIVYSDEYILNGDVDLSVVSGLEISDRDQHYIDYFRSGQGIPHLTVMGRVSCFEQHQFDESLEAREDPHLWVRLLQDCIPVYIPEPLAYKRRREGSLTTDPEMMYRNELQEINDLVDRFEELEPFEYERKQWAKYRYGRNLLARGRDQDAKDVFTELLKQDPLNIRVLAMTFTAYIPVDDGRIINILEKIAYYYRRFRR